MGERFRLRKTFDVSGFPPHAQAILKGLQKYGMIVADNGSDWWMSIAPDRRLQGLETLHRVKGADFEVVDAGARSVRQAAHPRAWPSCQMCVRTIHPQQRAQVWAREPEAHRATRQRIVAVHRQQARGICRLL